MTTEPSSESADDGGPKGSRWSSLGIFGAIVLIPLLTYGGMLYDGGGEPAPPPPPPASSSAPAPNPG